MHIHIAILGDRTEPVTKGFGLIPGIDKVYLICSDKHPESALSVGVFLSGRNIEFVTIISDDSDFSRIADTVLRIAIREGPSGPHCYSMNVTGGTRLMALAACHSACSIDATVYLIQESNGQDPDSLLTIPTVKVLGRYSGKGESILRFIHERTLNGGSVSNRDIETEFGMKKQQVSYYVRDLRESGLITTDSGVFDIERNTMNYRFNSIRLTEKGLTEVRFQR